MVAELPHIPERHLLTALLELNADLPAVAARTRTPLDEVTAWAHTDAVQAWLEAHHHFAYIAREHHARARATRTLDHLEELAKTTTDPIEKRRLLTAIIRGCTTILQRRNPHSPSQREEAGGWVRATSERVNHHSRNGHPPEPLPERQVGVGSLDSSTQNSVGPTSDLRLRTPSKKPDCQQGLGRASRPTASPEPTPQQSTTKMHPASPAGLARASRPTACAPSPGYTAPLSPISQLPFSHPAPNRPTPRSPAHLLATAGLPAP